MVWVEEGFKKIHKRVSVGLKRKGVGDCSESSHVFGLELQPEAPKPYVALSLTFVAL